MLHGAGTALNIGAVRVGSGAGVLLGHRLPERTRSTATDALGLVVLVTGGLSVADGGGAPAVSVGVVQGLLTLAGVLTGQLMPDAQVDAITAYLWCPVNPTRPATAGSEGRCRGGTAAGARRAPVITMVIQSFH